MLRALLSQKLITLLLPVYNCGRDSGTCTRTPQISATVFKTVLSAHSNISPYLNTCYSHLFKETGKPISLPPSDVGEVYWLYYVGYTLHTTKLIVTVQTIIRPKFTNSLTPSKVSESLLVSRPGHYSLSRIQLHYLNVV